MRIISGNFKGKKLLEPNDKNTRPLKDLTKESIFNIINHSKKFSINMINSKILDLFSGSGSFGLECLSRNANHVTFVENYKGVLPILKKNLLNLKRGNNYKVIETDIFKNFFNQSILFKFDIIFLDPPYKEKELFYLLNEIKIHDILKKEGIIIIHRHRKQKDLFPEGFKLLEEKKYGISKILFGNFS